MTAWSSLPVLAVMLPVLGMVVAPTLGLALGADGIAAAMLLTAAVVVTGVATFARAGFGTAPCMPERRGAFAFRPLLLAVWGGLNLAVTARDLFTLYIALELLTFAAAPLVCLDGRRETRAGALRYLLFALLGSVLYLLGVALIYGVAGTLDIGLLAGLLVATPPVLVAAALMTAGLMAKTALLPCTTGCRRPMRARRQRPRPCCRRWPMSCLR